MRTKKKLIAWTLGSAAVVGAVGVLSARLSPVLGRKRHHKRMSRVSQSSVMER